LLVLGYVSSPSEKLFDAAFALRERGLVSAVGVSSHDRSLLAALAAERRLDALMVRYSAAHPKAASDVFPRVGAKQLLTYTATRWGALLDPARMPPGERIPTATDCYRFVLSHPRVDLCLVGPSNASELSAALSASALGPLDEEGTAWMLRVGAHVRALATGRPSRLDWLRRARSAVGSLVTRGITEDVLSRLNR
jgi:aryl-alcohol dehydrogenase-like predicted oxidoreductase